MEIYRELLLQNGLRKTRYKIKVLEILSGSTAPMSANEIFELIVKLYKINISTVYRILEEFVSAGIVIKNLNESGEYIFCLHKFEDRHIHAHLFCDVCHRLYCYDMEKENIFENFKGFTPTSIQLKVAGICKNCSRR